jgi:hypothetical protein
MLENLPNNVSQTSTDTWDVLRLSITLGFAVITFIITQLKKINKNFGDVGTLEVDGFIVKKNIEKSIKPILLLLNIIVTFLLLVADYKYLILSDLILLFVSLLGTTFVLLFVLSVMKNIMIVEGVSFRGDKVIKGLWVSSSGKVHQSDYINNGESYNDVDIIMGIDGGAIAYYGPLSLLLGELSVMVPLVFTRIAFTQTVVVLALFIAEITSNLLA